ncbi:hypothetical protein OAS39_08760 [Pirellulales bacterium]|nr:hypothetical protein [Pirellulales bacterium]
MTEAFVRNRVSAGPITSARRTARLAFVGLTVIALGAANADLQAANDRECLDIGNATQLFVDGYTIQSRYGIDRKVQPAFKMEQPVMVSMHPWETEPGDSDTPGQPGKRVLLYGTVIYDPLQEQYRMWYMGRMGGQHGCEIPELDIPGENIHCDLTSYATSEDGFDWQRPNLGLVHFNGDLNNNILLDYHGASVMLDQKEPDPNKRYKAIGFIRRFHEIRISYSPDGIHWSEPQHATDRINEGALNACYVPFLDCYVAGSLERSEDPRYKFVDSDGDLQGKRVAVALRTEGKNLSNWDHKAYINPDDRDVPNTQFYGMTPFTYGDNGIVFGFLHVFRVKDPLSGFHDGPIDAQLVYSRDGQTWRRLEDRQPVIPLGPQGSFDGGMIMMTANGAFLHNDELIAYYTASEGEHGDQDTMTIGRASWPVDRLVAMEAGQEEAVLETKLLTVPNGNLEINVDAKGGYVTVEVLDATGKVLPGLASEQCVPIVGDSLRHQVRWKEGDLAELEQPLRLRFKMKNAKLYSLRFAPEK